ncbi:response regulator [bacterium]|nr:response regulator [bacterium]
MSQSRHKILIVDDERMLRLGLARCLENAGFETLTSEDGEQALALVRSEKPDLVLLDVMMRGMNGLQVCRALRGDPDTSRVRIVFLSARGQERERAEGLEAGADYYMTKPFDYRDLIRVVKQLLENG